MFQNILLKITTNGVSNVHQLNDNEFENMDINSQLGYLSWKLKSMVPESDIKTVIENFNQVNVTQIQKVNRKELLLFLELALQNDVFIQHELIQKLIEQTKYNEETAHLFVQYNSKNIEALQKYFDELSKISFDKSELKQLTTETKRKISLIVFKQLLNLKIDSEFFKKITELTALIKKANFDKNLLDCLADVVISDSVYQKLLNPESTKVIDEFLKLKNFCPVLILKEVVNNSLNFKNLADFDKMLGFARNDLSFSFCLIAKLFKMNKLREAEVFKNKAYIQFPQKSAEISEFYEKLLNE